MEKIKRKLLPKIVAPFYLLRIEKMYYTWLITFIISFLAILIDLFNGCIQNSISQGAVYGTCFAILTPFLVEFLVEFIGNSRSDKKSLFATYQGGAMAISFFTMVLILLFYATKLKGNLTLQLISTIIVGLISMYLYLVSKMDKHPTFLKEFQDKSYAEVEREAINTMHRDMKNTSKVILEDGAEVKL